MAEAPSSPAAGGTTPASPEQFPALDDLIPEVLDELRALAHRHLRREQGGASLQTTELVHEAYLRLAGHPAVTSRDRAYLFGAASRAMRQVLIDAARRRTAAKRTRPSGPQEEGAVDALSAELLDLEDALQRLELRHPRPTRVLECRFFGGLSVEETALALGVSPRTVKADWALARAWLHGELHERVA